MILVLGATGCLGQALLPALMQRGYGVRVLVRRAAQAEAMRSSGIDTLVGDLLSPPSLVGLCDGVDAVYFLVNPWRLQPFERSGQETVSLEAVRGLIEAADAAGVRPRVLTVGWLANRGDCMVASPGQSPVADALRSSDLPHTILCCGPVVSPQAILFGTLVGLLRSNATIPLPRWTTHSVQPIAIADLVGYLVDCLDEPLTVEDTFDAGGADVLTYETLLRVTAHALGLRRRFLRLPVLGDALGLQRTREAAALPEPVTQALLAGLSSDTVCSDPRLATLLPRRTLTYEESLRAIADQLRDQPTSPRA